MRKALNRLYYFSAGAFLLALVKYFFVYEFVFMPKFYIVEFLSFGFFLSIVYLFDRHIRVSFKENSQHEELLKSKEDAHAQEIAKLEEEMAAIKNEGSQGSTSEKEFVRLGGILSKGLKECDSETAFARLLLKNMAKLYEVGLAVCYIYDEPSDGFSVKATYGLGPDMQPKKIVLGEGLNGQAAKDMEPMVIEDVDPDYFNIESCSGSSLPKYIYLLPIVKDNHCIGLIEIATFGNICINSQWEQLNNYIADAMSL
ncbi:GAF domain-containing protein [Saccharicrinis fermentans]|uniref:Putative periplasmic ligand-binding sensor domain protein n=1 Tax=Saccharicrinis fermentans DSM 9555 = JCM 21142 TaxID=869213 RepID=W7XUX1_9BACT|nr:GAF domain-containing protein [Saccharicrinis fermentans]GAF01840.1 putative periplasmic ligand-binding sensor domain protein [Saccharicrinis fermentans DSM 9555 = JCM 21142]